MSRIVDIRHGRIAAACAHAVACAAETAEAPRLAQKQCEAEIILFPRVHRSYAERPRKRVTRRFQARCEPLAE